MPDREPVTRAAVGVADVRPWAEQLALAVGFALGSLTDPVIPPLTVSAVQVEERLRAALAIGPGVFGETVATRGAAAIRVACAYLAARNVAEAQLALMSAESILPRVTPRDTPAVASHATVPAPRSPAEP